PGAEQARIHISLLPSPRNPPAALLLPEGEVKYIADRHKHNDGEMGRRLRVHTRDSAPLLSDQALVFCCAAETADQTVDLAAPQPPRASTALPFHVGSFLSKKRPRRRRGGCGRQG